MRNFLFDLACFLFFSAPVSPLFDETDDDIRAEIPTAASSLGETSEAFLCRGCGNQVFHTADGFVRKSSPHVSATYSLSTVDASGKAVNVSVQRLVNPLKATFDLITVKDAVTRLHGKPETEASWFDG